MNGYTETIRKWATDDSHAGQLKQPDGIGEVGLGAKEAGRKLAIRFTLNLKGNRVNTVRYQVFGCGFTIAACAAAADLAEGASLEKVRNINASKIAQTLGGLPNERDYCADIAVKALQAAVNSADNNGSVKQMSYQEEEHGPRIAETDTVYSLLMDSPNDNDMPDEDRQLLAGVITLATGEPHFLAHALGLENGQLTTILQRYFPQIYLDNILFLSSHATTLVPEINSDVRDILRSHVPICSDGRPLEISAWLAEILTARAAQPGHLWIAMGLFERPELTAAIKRHLPTLAAANDKGMRWKRYLFKQACEMNGGMMCKSPNCGDCGDYALCFETE